MKLGGVEVSETVCRLFYRSRLAEVTRESLSVVSLVLARIRHVGRAVYQSGHRWIRSGFGDDGAAITVSHQNAWSILHSEDALRRRHIFFKRCLRFLNDADVISILDENVVNAFPAGTICPGAVNQNNIPNARRFVLRRKGAAGQEQ